jgi:prepilin-type N-terminal cleavage/methylation domain-containing protein
MKTKFDRGFTLIELLVVIAIIGILSSVVLASLNTARGKGADAAVKSNLNNMRAQAELIYDTNSPNNYIGICTQTNITNAMNSAKNAGGATNANNTTYATGGAASTVTCHVDAGGTVWGIEAPLKTAGFYCVDSTGVSTSTGASTLGTSDAACG